MNLNVFQAHVVLHLFEVVSSSRVFEVSCGIGRMFLFIPTTGKCMRQWQHAHNVVIFIGRFV